MTVSREIRHRVRRGVRSASAVLYAGSEFYCPCCLRHLRKFVPSRLGPSLVCPACGSYERNRLLLIYLDKQTDVFKGPLRMLHFAPEACLSDRFRAASQLDYITADLDDDKPLVDVGVDITAMDFPDASFDIVIVSHVLEHVPDDERALLELRRILRPAGRAVLQHPIDHERERTYEDPAVIEPEARLREFGQRDHVRIYGRDFVDRVRHAALSVQYVPYVDQLPREMVRQSALRDASRLRSDDLYICSPSSAPSSSAFQ